MNVYQQLKAFKKKYPWTISWRLKKHAKIIENHLNPEEEILYAFSAQKNNNPFDIITTYAVVVTNKRILLASKRMIFGYFLVSITPDMFNDLNIKMGLVWGKVIIDTVKEVVVLSNIQKDALSEIETNITEYIIEEKKKVLMRPTSRMLCCTMCLEMSSAAVFPCRCARDMPIRCLSLLRVKIWQSMRLPILRWRLRILKREAMQASED